jgi:hypothetical protein
LFEVHAKEKAMVDPIPELRVQKPTASAMKQHADLSRLDVFLGEWALRGEQLDGPFGPAAPIRAHQSYEWLAGRHFMLMLFEGDLGENEIGCAEIIGEAKSGHGFCAQAFYNDGTRREWKLGEKRGVWIRTGEETSADGVLKIRCTTAFAPTADLQTAKWEYTKDGDQWATFWNVTARRTD